MNHIEKIIEEEKSLKTSEFPGTVILRLTEDRVKPNVYHFRNQPIHLEFKKRINQIPPSHRFKYFKPLIRECIAKVPDICTNRLPPLTLTNTFSRVYRTIGNIFKWIKINRYEYNAFGEDKRLPIRGPDRYDMLCPIIRKSMLSEYFKSVPIIREHSTGNPDNMTEDDYECWGGSYNERDTKSMNATIIFMILFNHYVKIFEDISDSQITYMLSICTDEETCGCHECRLDQMGDYEERGIEEEIRWTREKRSEHTEWSKSEDDDPVCFTLETSLIYFAIRHLRHISDSCMPFNTHQELSNEYPILSNQAFRMVMFFVVLNQTTQFGVDPRVTTMIKGSKVPLPTSRISSAYSHKYINWGNHKGCHHQRIGDMHFYDCKRCYASSLEPRSGINLHLDAHSLLVRKNGKVVIYTECFKYEGHLLYIQLNRWTESLWTDAVDNCVAIWFWKRSLLGPQNLSSGFKRDRSLMIPRKLEICHFEADFMRERCAGDYNLNRKVVIFRSMYYVIIFWPLGTADDGVPYCRESIDIYKKAQKLVKHARHDYGDVWTNKHSNDYWRKAHKKLVTDNINLIHIDSVKEVRVHKIDPDKWTIFIDDGYDPEDNFTGLSRVGDRMCFQLIWNDILDNRAKNVNRINVLNDVIIKCHHKDNRL